MKTVAIAGVTLSVKDYYCASVSEPEEYLGKEDGKLWLYVEITDACNAGCPFCVHGASGHAVKAGHADPARYEEVLRQIIPHVSGVSVTGGEPMLFPEITDQIIGITDQIAGSSLEIDLVTNGTDLRRLSELTNLPKLSTIHISRHHTDDSVNRRLMDWAGAPSMEEITKLMSGMKDPGAVVLNCVLQRGGVSSMEDVCGYLSMAAAAGIRNTSFITMFDCNEFTREKRVSPAQFPVMSGGDEAKEALQRIGRKYGMRFALWNHLHDYDHCSCVTGSCATAQGETGFYFRCPGTAQSAAYCRQLVYTADDRLRDGFGGKLLK